jgi:hypothetical protein
VAEQREDPVEFWDREDARAHEGFQRWRERHFGDGFFLNLRSSRSVMLHRSACPHLGATDWGPEDPDGFWGSLTRNKKVCHADPRVLERWALEKTGAPPARCSDCERLGAF